MVDIGAKVSFARSQMIFNVDVEANLSDYLAALLRPPVPLDPAIEALEGVADKERSNSKSLLQYFSGSFTFASLFEDFVSGSRVNIHPSYATWTKLFLFTGADFQPFYPNFNPSFSRLAALEYVKERQLSSDCLSFSLRRRLGPIFSIVASASWVATQTFRSSHRRCWSLAFVADDRRVGLEMLAGFNHEGNCCVGFKKEIGESGVAFRVSTVVLRAFDCPNSDWKNCLEIGLEM